MLTSKSFLDCEKGDPDFLVVVRKIQFMISVSDRNLLSEIEVDMLLDFLKNSKNKNMTLKELVDATERYCDNQYNIEKLYGTISTKFISSILDEYNKKQRSAALDELHRIIEDQNNKPYVMSLEEKKAAILAEFDRWKRTENPAEILNLGGCTFDFMQNDFGFKWTTDEKNKAIDEAVKYIEERKRMELLEAKSTDKAKIEAFLSGLVTDKTPAYSQAKTFLLHEKFMELSEREKLEKLLDLTITKAK